MAHLRALAVVIFSLLCAACTEAPANCRDNVAAAFERLKTSGQPYRRETVSVVSDHQTLHEIAEFLSPDRMREIENIGVPGYGTVETIRIGARAWSNEGGRWSEWEPGLAEEIYGAGKDFSPSHPVPANTAFDCLGRVEFKGKTYIGYRERSVKAGAVVIVADSTDRLTEKEEQEVLSMRYQTRRESHTVFVDWPSMLPAYDLWAPENQLDTPTHEEHYTYPGDISIEPPAHYGFRR